MNRLPGAPDEETPSPDELAEAEALARLLEGESLGHPPSPDLLEALAASRLLAASGRHGEDEVAARRLRRALTPGRVRPVTKLALSVLAAAAALTLFFLPRGQTPPKVTDDLLAAREAEAREAVARLSLRGHESARSADILSALTKARLESLRQGVIRETLVPRTKQTPPRKNPSVRLGNEAPGEGAA
ncbi:MAG: hypothetical protein JNK60_00550 [Acidobacteria bacterium]|nr:hypothetical protein [Acidobacteriota bacterium]